MASLKKWYLISGVVCAAFAVYGSLVPLHYQPLPWREAVARFAQIRYLALGVDSRADFVSNILLFIPLGFLFMGGLRADRSGLLATALAACAVIASAIGLSVGIEFAQVFFPPRTVSINDIVAETAGGIIGVGVWVLVGQALTDWTVGFLREREPARRGVRVLSAYAVMFILAQLLPFDVTISMGELAHKFHEGRIVVVPFAYHWESTLTMLWDLGGDVVLQIPIGILAVVAWQHRARGRPALHAFAAGALVVAAIELAQVFVYSRYADVTDLLTGCLGIALGVFIARVRLGTERRSPIQTTVSAQPGLWLAVVVWTGVLIGYHWYPFNFTLNEQIVREKLPVFLAPPFSSYYWGSEFHAFTELSRKLLMALPLGTLLRLAWPLHESGPIRRLQIFLMGGATFVALVAIEAGQIFLPDRIADLTDAFVGQAGVALGFWLGSIAGAARSDEVTV